MLRLNLLLCSFFLASTAIVSSAVTARGVAVSSNLARTAPLTLPQGALLLPTDIALHLDYYQLTMGQADFDVGNEAVITANYYVRKVPQGAYLVSAGLEQVIHHILNFKLSDEALDWLETTGDFSAAYLAELKNFRFDGSVYAVPEGTVVFPNAPIINVIGKSRDVQLFETYLLAVMNFQTLVATKSARIAQATQGRAFYDFGARRAHARDAGVLAARAAYIGGAAGTSLVSAAQFFAIPHVGTMAHKFVSERPNELDAFRAYAKSFPHNTTLLLDTYDTIEGAKNACVVAHEMAAQGHQLRCVRLDSGDLVALSRQVRALLDAEGLEEVKIIASNDLDEFRIAALLAADAPIDSFGVGTRLATAANFNPHTNAGGVSALAGVYKLVESDGVPMGKRSKDEPEKATLPARKQVYRLSDTDGNFYHDLIIPWHASPPAGATALLEPIIVDGELVYSFPTLPKIQEHTAKQLAKLPEQHKELDEAKPYSVKIDPALQTANTPAP
ncbi:MAG: nicotinate phosphoribosyltransferase [Pseudomonadota bacterium]|nr:nicotinate phosphoribosyltransferase [Pseudomonadota bacterium]